MRNDQLDFDFNALAKHSASYYCARCCVASEDAVNPNIRAMRHLLLILLLISPVVLSGCTESEANKAHKKAIGSDSSEINLKLAYASESAGDFPSAERFYRLSQKPAISSHDLSCRTSINAITGRPRPLRC